ncbi:MAG: DUF4595 domain-containing protein [Mediterranea sp.]|jgi:hypothetical protein|nr:DUF4595 domain-containing protein [Mediterranea sp.]
MKLRTFIFALLSMAACASFTSCGSGDDNDAPGDEIHDGNSLIKPEKVFPGIRLKTFNGVNLIYDADGLLIEMGEYLTLIYEGETVTVVGASRDNEAISYTLTIGADGFVKHMEGTYGAEQDDCYYTYSADGYLIKIVNNRSTPSGPEPMYTLLDWEDGTLISTASSDHELTGFDDPTADIVTFDYGATPVENKGGFMALDDIFDNNSFGMCTNIPYFGGMMGKGCKYIPVRADYTRHIYSDEYACTFDANGYPTSLRISEIARGIIVDNFTLGWY